MRTSLVSPPGLPVRRATVLETFSALGVRPEEPTVEDWTVIDTPDRRIWAAGQALVCCNGRLSLLPLGRISAGEPTAVGTCSGAMPRMLAQWPAGALQDALRAVVRNRALIPALQLRMERLRGSRVDELGKTVARIEAWLITSGTGPAHKHIHMVAEALRGYGPEQLAVVAAMLGRGWSEADEDPCAVFIEQNLGLPLPTPADFPDGDTPSGTALRACLVQTVARLGELERSVVEDIDSEFLHQHRVLLRRIRSLAAIFRCVLPAPDSLRLRELLRGWARCSNPVRDLDVWLEARDEHIALIPTGLRPGLALFFVSLAADRAARQHELAVRLNSKAHQEERAEVLRLLAKVGDGPDASVPLRRLAAQRTWKAYRRMAAEAATVDTQTPPEAVHQVRIRCKKLRYLLDSCGCHTAPKEWEQLRDSLKSVQAVLGAFNDACVQALALEVRVCAVGTSPATLLAVGALLGSLERQRADLHDDLLLGLAELASTKTRNRYRRLFWEKDRS